MWGGSKKPSSLRSTDRMPSSRSVVWVQEGAVKEALTPTLSRSVGWVRAGVGKGGGPLTGEGGLRAHRPLAFYHDALMIREDRCAEGESVQKQMY